MTAHERLSIQSVAPEAYKGILEIEQYTRTGDIEPILIHLLKIRASQINGCAFCLDMHAKEARADGEDQRRIDVLAGWREVPEWFSPAEQAVLAFTEEVTLIGQGGVSDQVWQAMTHHFGNEQVVRLLMAVAAINVWNRMAVATHQALPPLETD